MSIPLVFCRFVKAFDDEKAFIALARDLLYNFEKGHFTNFPCKHEPKCSISSKNLNKLYERLAIKIQELKEDKREHQEPH